MRFSAAQQEDACNEKHHHHFKPRIRQLLYDAGRLCLYLGVFGFIERLYVLPRPVL